MFQRACDTSKQDWTLTSGARLDIVNWQDTCVWKDCNEEMTQWGICIAILLNVWGAVVTQTTSDRNERHGRTTALKEVQWWWNATLCEYGKHARDGRLLLRSAWTGCLIVDEKPKTCSFLSRRCLRQWRKRTRHTDHLETGTVRKCEFYCLIRVWLLPIYFLYCSETSCCSFCTL